MIWLATRTFRPLDRAALERRARALGERIGLNVDVTRPLRAMTAIERELIAILQALSSETIRVLILDEPTSVLTEAEKGVLFSVIRSVKAKGVGVIYITHRLDEVFEIADRFTVFRGGRVVATDVVGRVNRSGERIAELMLGASLGEVYPAKVTRPGDVLLSAESISYGGAFTDVSFAARRGQVLGIFGLLGSGLDQSVRGDLENATPGSTLRTPVGVRCVPSRLRFPKQSNEQRILRDRLQRCSDLFLTTTGRITLQTAVQYGAHVVLRR